MSSEVSFPLSKQSSIKTSTLSTNTLIFLGVGWALVSLLFFLFFSVPPPGEEQASWYLIGITILETGAFLVSSLFCFRNWRSGQIVSGRSVWLWIFLGLLSYAVGNGFFYLWGNVFELDPAVSLGDAFYLLSYVFLAGGMLQAVLPRRLNLDSRQWIIVAVIGILGIGIAYFFNYKVAETASEATPPALEEVAAEGASPQNGAALQDEAAETEPVTADSQITPTSSTEETEDAVSDKAPTWAILLDNQLAIFEGIVGILYVIGDCFLLVVAATLLVAFWGGRFSQSWKLIAIAAFCLYIADMFFAYYVNQADYQEGSLWEVFWTFSAVFFGLGAVVEHAISSRSRRTSRRRRA